MGTDSARIEVRDFDCAGHRTVGGPGLRAIAITGVEVDAAAERLESAWIGVEVLELERARGGSIADPEPPADAIVGGEKERACDRGQLLRPGATPGEGNIPDPNRAEFCAVTLPEFDSRQIQGRKEERAVDVVQKPNCCKVVAKK